MSAPALYGVAGDPVAHSLSPLIHNAWMAEAGLQAEYRAFHVPSGVFTEGLRELEGQGARGLNVTLPHKAAALAAAEGATFEAKRIGAANVLTRTETGWRAANTDTEGLRRDLARHVDLSPGITVALIGAGGAARAAADALAQAGCRLLVVNRTPAKAHDLIETFTAKEAGGEAYALEDAAAALDAADLAVNASSAGHAGGVGFDWPDGRGRLLYDLSYGGAADAALAPARAAGWRGVDGLGMLVAQAALSFELWFGRTPDESAALAACRRALEAKR